MRRTLGRVGAADRVRLHRQLVTWLRSAHAAGLDREDVEALFEAARHEVAEDVA
ncbi:hypothetical protein SAMN05421812_12757 [Asanoa hainanensis]|uniref:Uncharacterized protein n=1 Tax=Asanoa hainanensis TaxID=560556 RepID=A0A239PGY2_9ACTN|nr:hypothetical protein [Asanoa hainanensis]SNT65848.1 hypothetical protein SAMN05421812_12757 [Asanoa hainanensis]